MHINNTEHFLLKCSLYERLRYDLFVNLSSHLNINNLLFCDSNLPDCENESNFLVIQYFIIKSKRFTPRSILLVEDTGTGIKLMFVTLVTYIPTWRTRKMVN
jgi:hypothetical protein